MMNDILTAAPEGAFHAGEQALQQRTGMHERMAQIGPHVIRKQMPEQHRAFLEKLPTLFVGSVDDRGRPWASVLVGRPGFLHTPDARRLHVAALPRDDDRLHANLKLGAPLGLLGIEPQTRRRNRLNGRVGAIDEGGFEVQVDQSFGNCPQYIQARTPVWVEAAKAKAGARAAAHNEGALLSDAARALIASADTAFIASSAPPALRGARHGGVDVSHRGGRPGFIRVDEEHGASVLTLPDYRGNFFFNTLGNLQLHPWAGLLFIDYASGDTLQVTGATELVWSGPMLHAFEGAQRLVRLRVEAGVWTPHAVPLRWSAPVFAPELAADTADEV